MLVFGDQGGSIDLRYPLDADAYAILLELGLPREFSILTAWNPLGKPRSAVANAAADQELASELKQLKVPVIRLQGCSPERDHCEDSLAVGIDRDPSVELARRYGQDAIFRFENDRFWLVGALLEFEPVALPLEAARTSGSR